MRQLIHIATLLVLLPAAAHADHHGMVMPSGGDDSQFSASVALLAATFSPSAADNMDYGGNYQGAIVGGGWAMGRYAAGASWAYYRILKNGAEQYGVGDLVAHGQVALVARKDVQAGALLAVSAPTGSDVAGLGMGHPMVMPAAFGVWHHDRLVLAGSLGYSRAITSGAHVHGMAPLVEPMNMAEVTWSAGADVAIAGGVRAGARLAGGVPDGELPGTDRAIGAVRVAWGSGAVDTAAELQAGLAGDPFNIRAVVSTAFTF